MSTPEPTPQPEVVWQYAGIDLDEPDGILPYDGTPRVITRRTLRRPLVPAGPWEPALRIAPECSTTNQRVHADCDGCDCHCHTKEAS